MMGISSAASTKMSRVGSGEIPSPGPGESPNAGSVEISSAWTNEISITMSNYTQMYIYYNVELYPLVQNLTKVWLCVTETPDGLIGGLHPNAYLLSYIPFLKLIVP